MLENITLYCIPFEIMHVKGGAPLPGRGGGSYVFDSYILVKIPVNSTLEIEI